MKRDVTLGASSIGRRLAALAAALAWAVAALAGLGVGFGLAQPAGAAVRGLALTVTATATATATATGEPALGETPSRRPSPRRPTVMPQPTRTPTATPLPVPVPTPAPLPAACLCLTATPEISSPVGLSWQGRPIVAYRFGTGRQVRAIFGGIHGGYEWNTVHLADAFRAYLGCHPDAVPVSVTLYIIPNLNPDGYAAGSDFSPDRYIGRPNAHNVDLNRNWAYHWQEWATHGSRPVSGGDGEFSEPETAAARDFIAQHQVSAVIFYHSAAARVFAGAEDIEAGRIGLARAMERATRYRYAPEGVPGQVTTGDAIDYLSTIGVAAVEVELADHHDLDWKRSLNGLLAFLNWDGQA